MLEKNIPMVAIYTKYDISRASLTRLCRRWGIKYKQGNILQATYQAICVETGEVLLERKGRENFAEAIFLAPDSVTRSVNRHHKKYFKDKLVTIKRI